ncbi:Uncharacterised protein [uncultured archaeon]|nr:Uncharacterised protein [uncultured archaeon]
MASGRRSAGADAKLQQDRALVEAEMARVQAAIVATFKSDKSPLEKTRLQKELRKELSVLQDKLARL